MKLKGHFRNFDLWVSNLAHKYVGPTGGGQPDFRGYICDDSKIYRNTGKPDYNFVDMREVSGIPKKPIGGRDVYQGDELWSHATAADFDNDGLTDVYVPQTYDLPYSYSLLFKNQGGFRFSEVSEKAGTRAWDTHAGAWADIDNDGKMDLITAGKDRVDGKLTVRLLRNILQTGNHFLRIKLIGSKSGRTSFTTQVRAFVQGGGRLLRQLEGTTGTLNQQNDPTIHFGLGAANRVERLEVRWTSGRVQVLKDLQVDRTYVVQEP